MGFGRDLPTSFHEALAAAREILSRNEGLARRDTVATEAEQIVIAACRPGKERALSRVELFARLRDPFPREAGERVLKLAAARAEGGLLQHLTGVQAFLDHEYEVGPDVLVPRPETEILARAAMDALAAEFGDEGPGLGFELGVGSGILSVELLHRFPRLRMAATEVSPRAAARARANADRILGHEGARRLEITLVPEGQALPLPPSAAGASFLVSNPPYLVRADEIDDEVRRHEPAEALYAPEGDPLFFYRAIAEGAPGGQAFVELASERAQDIEAVFAERGWSTRVIRDLNGRERVLHARRERWTR
jgi:release factor glutamine methyltransferase